MPNIQLEPELESYVREKVESGQYSNAGEVMREALRRMMQQERSDEAKLAWLREAVRAGLDSPVENWEEDDNDLITRLHELASARK